MKKLLLVFLCASAMIGQDALTPVPLDLQIEFFKARSITLAAKIEVINAQSAEDKTIDTIKSFCGALHREAVQHPQTGAFGCLSPTPPPSHPLPHTRLCPPIE